MTINKDKLKKFLIHFPSGSLIIFGIILGIFGTFYSIIVAYFNYPDSINTSNGDFTNISMKLGIVFFWVGIITGIYKFHIYMNRKK